MKDLRIDTKILNIFGGNIDATQVFAVRNLIQQEVREAKIKELERLLDVTSRGDGMPSGTYETDVIYGGIVKDRLDQLKNIKPPFSSSNGKGKDV